MKRRKINHCIVHLKSKLKNLDDLLPFFVEMKAQNVLKSAVFVTPTPADFRLIKENVVLYEAMKAFDAKLVYLNKYKSRLLNMLRHLILLRQYFFRPTVSIQIAESHGRAIDKFVEFNRRVLGGKLFLSNLTNIPKIAQRKFVSYDNLTLDPRERTPEIARRMIEKAKNSDAVLVSFPMDPGDKFGLLEFSENLTVCEVGNPRILPTWQEYLHQVGAKNLPADLQGPYFFFILGPLEIPNPDNDNVWDEANFVKCISILKQYNKKIHTVFKPHPATNIARLKSLLESIGYDNYRMMNVHQFVISKSAKFAFSPYSSTVLIDAHAVGCPTIDFARYDTRGAHISEGKSMLDEAVDFYLEGDEEKLVSTVDSLLGRSSPKKKDAPEINRFLEPKHFGKICKILNV